MDFHNNQNTPAAATIPAATQSCDCATSADAELMRRANDTRKAYYANVRRDIALACDEVPQS